MSNRARKRALHRDLADDLADLADDLAGRAAWLPGDWAGRAPERGSARVLLRGAYCRWGRPASGSSRPSAWRPVPGTVHRITLAGPVGLRLACVVTAPPQRFLLRDPGRRCSYRTTFGGA